ncbi:MAG: DUF126 domain-containing protein [Alphaproteobacteria bacterium]|nr:DUF126 domain-containing protein [Alphaproteobacteria bacterium]
MGLTAAEQRGRVLVAGDAAGPLLRLTEPISFWGGVDPATGRITDPRHPQHDAEIAGRVLAIPATIGSSSSSAIILELMRVGRAPAALLLGQVDAILTLGVIVGREMGYATLPVVELAADTMADLPEGEVLRVMGDGRIMANGPGGGAT